MFSPAERMIAFRYLRPRRSEGFISLIAAFAFLGITIGVATLIVVMSVMNGFRAELLSRVLGFNSHVVVYADGRPIRDHGRLVAEIRKIDGVVTAAAVVDGQVMASAGERSSGAFVRGIAPEDLKRHRLLHDNLSPGAFAGFRDGTLILGQRLAAYLAAGTGSRVRLLSPKCAPTPVGCVPGIATFDVAGRFHVGMSEYDRGYLFMPLETAQDFFRVAGGVTNIEITVADPDRVEAVAERVRALQIPRSFVRTWQEIHSTFFGALKVERNVMFLILTLIVLVAAFNIVSSMIMLVKQKGQAIAILCTMGATRGNILRLFFMTGATIGVAGTFFGVLLGLGVAYNIDGIKRWVEGLLGAELFPATVYFLSSLPSKVELPEVAQIVAMALVLTFLATIYPAWRASRLDPVEALRNE
ncbi:MAG: lipoprotein-releasing ABC transporter permease subunit [Rhodospirillaceae bacterium]|nr:lipoprotein-releasing ABC transporter permease subunit [Rhodospirillaceae bacterium]MDE0704671.1 lipoprotein-releasing ABC transporter permease subunit [Rhodospirillaceae bacterium]